MLTVRGGSTDWQNLSVNSTNRLVRGLSRAGPSVGYGRRPVVGDPTTGDYTGLLRYDPGVDTSPTGARVHDYWEEVYLLEGDLTDLRLGTTFTAGMYACRPPGMKHGPWRTERGVTMLEVRYKAVP